MVDRHSPDWAAVTALALTGAVVVLEPITGVTSLLARLAALGAFGAADAQVRQVTSKVAHLKERIEALEQLHVPYRRISGAPVQLLALCVMRESEALFNHVLASEAQVALGLDVHQCREAIEDLCDFGLLKATPVMSALSYHNLFLTGSGYVAAAPSVLPEVDVGAELSQVISHLSAIKPDQPQLRVAQLLESTGVAAPRLELMLKALVERGLIQGHGPGSPGQGSYFTVMLTNDGRRFLRDAAGGAA
jgi:hypothetical protein